MEKPIAISPDAISFRYIRASGPGGQHVNKVSTAVEMRVDLSLSGLPPAVRNRLVKLAGQKVNANGEIVIQANESRSQAQNKRAALARLDALVAQAAARPVRRIPTRPSKSVKARRLDNKSKRSRTKALRRKPADD